MEKKMTVVEMYTAIIDKYADVMSDEDRDFLTKRKDLVAKKNSTRKPSANAQANDGIKANILEEMADGKAYTITEMIKTLPSCAELTNQRVSALVRQLRDAELVVRSESKGKAYFTKA